MDEKQFSIERSFGEIILNQKKSVTQKFTIFWDYPYTHIYLIFQVRIKKYLIRELKKF
jgi:hypothetical protein